VPRAGLSTRSVTETAADLADELGWEHLSMAAVAERCGVRQPSLYKHVSSLSGLRLEVSVLALNELARVLSAALVGKAGSDALLALALAFRSYGRLHPGRYSAAVAAPTGEHSAHAEAAAAVLHVVEATLAGFGLTGDDAVDAARALRAALHGFVDLEANHAFGLPTDVDRSYRRLIEGIDTTMSSWAKGDSMGSAPVRSLTR
jgi:AcrR family transcriptional regulator